MQKRNKCIFCGGTGMTKEHVFGKWIKKIGLRGRPFTAHHTSHPSDDGNKSAGMTKGLGRFHRSGKPHAHQMRIVCETCNGGWLRGIQNNAKGPLEDLIKGNWRNLSSAEMDALAAYATMVTMELEFAHPMTIAINPEARLQFKETSAPLPNWQILLGFCQTIKLDPGAMWHRSAYMDQSGFPPPKRPIRPNLQTTTFCLDRCFFHTISGPADMLPDPIAYSDALEMTSIWPACGSTPSSPRIFSDEDIGRAAALYWTAFGLPERPTTGLSWP